MSREWTADEVREQFLSKVWEIISYWKTVATDQDRMEGAIFSILATIDGDDPKLPSFLLVSAPHADDKAFCRKSGKNWYPQESEGCDIAGELHDHFHSVGRNMGMIA